MKHINVSVFVPHAGCPHQCSFCNQRSISGAKSQPTAQDVRDAALVAMRSSPEGIKDGEIAFFGGSFTAIDRDYMIELLSSAQEFIGENGFKGIRTSTRPDAVDGEICDILEKYHVTAVELGAQSTNDKVLAMNRRGHTREDIFRSAWLLKERGFELGLQMMTGLYGSNDEDSIGTARDIISLSPDTARIYPTVVIENTELAELYRNGEYRPQTPEEAAVLCAKILPMFERAGIKVIRLGLHSGGGASHDVTAVLGDYAKEEFRKRVADAGLDLEYEDHAADSLLDRSLFKTHPEYFPMHCISGERREKGNWCISNPDVAELLASNAVNLAEKLVPSTHRHYFWSCDFPGGWCHCPACSAMTVSDQNLASVNAMAKALREADPQAAESEQGTETRALFSRLLKRFGKGNS